MKPKIVGCGVLDAPQSNKKTRCSHRPATRIVSLILSLVMLFSITASIDMSAFALAPTSGKCGANVNYYFDKTNGTLTISGSGAMYDYNNNNYNNPFYDIDSDYYDEIKTVIINDGVTYIGSAAFAALTSISEVVISNTVNVIGDDAFNYTGITDITIPSSVTKIGYAAFDDCESLNTIKFLNRNTQIDNIIGEFTIDEIAVIYGYKNSTAQQYAKKYDRKFVELSEHPAQKKFNDIKNYDAYNDYVKYASINNQFLKGTNPPYNTVFSPARAIDRAMMVTILYRMAGEPYANYNPYRTSPFSDIKDTSVYYYDAACWALKNGITTERTFKPFDNVTREQTATFLYRYAQDNGKLGNSAYKSVNLNAYHDGNSISHFAVDAMKWANYNGMITGTQQGYANPQGATQRIHATKILYGFGKTCNIGNFA